MGISTQGTMGGFFLVLLSTVPSQQEDREHCQWMSSNPFQGSSVPFNVHLGHMLNRTRNRDICDPFSASKIPLSFTTKTGFHWAQVTNNIGVGTIS